MMYSMAKESSSSTPKHFINDPTVCLGTKKLQHSCWSDLEEELLDIILERLTDLSDLIRFHCVCHSWRSAAARKLCGNNVPPLLLFNKSTSIIVSSAYGRKRNHKFKKFDVIMQTPVVSSHRGWLLLRSSNYKTAILEILLATLSRSPPPPPPPRDQNKIPLHLFNPFSGMLVSLSPHPRPLSLSGPLEFITSCSASDPNCIIFVYNHMSGGGAFYGLRHRKWSLCTEFSTMLFEDAIFYKGHFYAVDREGVLRRLLADIDSNSWKEEVVSADSRIVCTAHRYLVESSSRGGVLLMVVRRVPRTPTETNLFKIFEFDWSNGKWKKVSSLGDQALFLAHYNSKLVSIGVDNHEYRQNTIYFLDDTCVHMNSCENDSGLYDLSNQEFEPLNISSRHARVQYQRWFQPAV